MRTPVCLLLLFVTLSGCSIMPAPGPSGVSVRSAQSADPNKVAYVHIPLTPAVVAHTGPAPTSTLTGKFSDQRPRAALRVGTGDLLSVSIFEASTGGLFIPTDAGARPGNFIQLPTQEVDAQGNLTIPYAGEIHAAGRTVVEVQNEIVAKLKNRAIEPQVLISIVDQRSNRVTVVGDVAVPLVFNLSAAGERVLDAIARAQGSKFEGYETWVTLVRGRREATVYYKNLVSQPSNNIFLQPGDLINVVRDSRTFLALGASGDNGQINFDEEHLSLAEGIARAGGLREGFGDPQAVYLYRLEPKEHIAEMGYDVTPYLSNVVPTIYSVDLRDPGGLFLAGKLSLHDKDALYIANAPTVELVKLIDIFRSAIGAAREGSDLYRNLHD